MTAVRFMVDSTEGKDGHCETIMDYVVSWTLRRAQNECCYDPGKDRLYRYCRNFLGMLIGRKIVDSDLVIVETWKQENLIDLWVHVMINDESHDILIEDKYYSSLHDNQLERYREYFDKWLSENRPYSLPHYVILSCKDSDEVDEYKGYGFDVYSWDQMLEYMSEGGGILEPSGSDIFDEFWINW